MDEEDKKMLEETLELEKENNKLIRKVRSVQKQAHFFRVAYYVIIVGIAVGAFYFLQPYIDRVESVWDETSAIFSKFKGTTSPEN